VASEDEQIESEVETTDKVAAIGDQSQPREQPSRKQTAPDGSRDETPHIDIRG
jgi:hypothetical protein